VHSLRGVFLDLETVDVGDLDLGSLGGTLLHWDWYSHTHPAEIPRRIEAADVVVTNKCPLGSDVLSGAKQLRLVAVAATGTNNVDLEAARALGLTVCNIRDYCSEAVAQHVITLLLNLLTCAVASGAHRGSSVCWAAPSGRPGV